jgi:predicted dehydrogenase
MVESSVVPAAAGAKVVAALIGSGFMGSVHSRALRAAGIEMSGVLSSSSEKSKIAAQELGIQRAYKNLDELLEDEAVNLVHILTPNNTHAELISRALEAGKNIVCEKPLVTSSSEALSLTQTAAELGLVGAVPFVYRYHPMARQARYRVSKGDLGRILSIKGQYLQDWLLDQNETNWRVSEQAGGPSRAFADIGIHLCDLVEFVSGQKIVRLVSSLNTAYPSRAGNPVSTEDMVAVMAELEGGGLLSLMVSQVAAGHKNALSIELHGSSEALRFEQEEPEKLWIGRKDGNRIEMRDPALLSADARRLTNLPSGHPEGYFDAFTSFMRDVEQAVMGNDPEGLPRFADGARAAVLTDAVLKSALEGAWVDLTKS